MPKSHAILPLVGVSACVKHLDDMSYHAVQHKYLAAVATGARAQPLVIPALAETDIPALLERLDGIMLTGSPSNVEPARYGGPPSRPGVLHDLERDAVTLPLIKAAIAAGVPLLAICRGFQEANVALGGTLHQHLEEVPGRFDHRGDRSRDTAHLYRPRHPVSLVQGGLLAGLAGVPEVTVNSLHGQGVERLAPGLIVEATAPDGTIEAFRVANARNFALGVQWHAEWRLEENPLSAAIFAEFGRAVHARAAQKAASPALVERR